MKNKKAVQAGGKLYIAGEYSILTPGQTAIIQFIPIYMQADIQPASTYRIQSDMFPFAVDLTPNYGLCIDPRNRASDERLPPVTRSSDFSL